jgi:hypothetical protein
MCNPRLLFRRIFFIVIGLALFAQLTGRAALGVGALPTVGTWTHIANPPAVDSFAYYKNGEQPVDFSIWQATDGTWQLWSCVRSTTYPGNTRLFYGWEGSNLTSGWTATGVKLTSDTTLGEVQGGLQAPHVTKDGSTYTMLYGAWDFIAKATSTDGKNFTRYTKTSATTSSGQTTELFRSGVSGYGVPRDAMLMKVGGVNYVYYTAHDTFPASDPLAATYPELGVGKDFVRTSTDLINFSAPELVAFGGTKSGYNTLSAECPTVRFDPNSGFYYLFRTQNYTGNGGYGTTHVYRSTDPTYFGDQENELLGAEGVDTNYYVGTLAVAAPEIFDFNGKIYIAALDQNYSGFRVAELTFVPEPASLALVGIGGISLLRRRR